MHNETTAKHLFSTQTIAKIAIITAVTCVLAPLSLPIGPIPISLTNFVIYLGLYALGTKNELISYLAYLLLGAIGLPVFSGFVGGPGKLIGPTGGYLIGFLPMASVAGLVIEHFPEKKLAAALGMIAGTLICYILGTAWFCIQANATVSKALGLCILPFLPGDGIKIAVAVFMGPKLRRALTRSELY